MKYIGRDELADEILAAQTPVEAKAIAPRVPRHLHHDWHTLKLNVMKIVLHAKADNYEPFRTTLLESLGRRLEESTKDVFWECGLSPHDTATTIPEYYPGYNKLGAILEQVRSELLGEEKNMAHISTDEPEAPETPKASEAPVAQDGTDRQDTTNAPDARDTQDAIDLETITSDEPGSSDQPVASTSGAGYTGGNSSVHDHSEVPEQSKTEKGNSVLDDSSAFSVQTTNPHCVTVYIGYR